MYAYGGTDKKTKNRKVGMNRKITFPVELFLGSLLYGHRTEDLTWREV